MNIALRGIQRGEVPWLRRGIFSDNEVQREENTLMSYGISRNVRSALFVLLSCYVAFCECLHALFLSLALQTCCSEELP